MNASKEPRSRPKEMQMTLEEMHEKSKKWADDSAVSLRIDKSVMHLILLDMMPYNVVNGAAFKRLNLNDPGIAKKYNLKTYKFYGRKNVANIRTR